MRSIIFALALCAGPAFASDLSCSFAKECIDGDTCEDTTFTFTVEGMNDKGRAVTMVSDTETLRGNIIETDGLLNVVFFGNGALHMLSTTADMDARYTVHLPGPMAILYQGTCDEVAN